MPSPDFTEAHGPGVNVPSRSPAPNAVRSARDSPIANWGSA